MMEKRKQWKGFTDFQLKWLALVLMVFDHIHYFLSLRERCRNGFPCWAGCRRRCFCSVCWKALRIRGTGKIFSADLCHRRGHGSAAICISQLCETAGWVCAAESDAGHLFHSAGHPAGD